MRLDEKQTGMLNVVTTAKFLATADGGGRVNVAPVLSLCHYRDDLLVFGDLMMWKTKKNLAQNNRVGILVMDENLAYYTVGGTFAGFETKGEAYDLISNSPLIKYNAYSGFRSAGLIRVESAGPVRALSKWKVIREWLPGVLWGGGVSFRRVVSEKFRRLRALKALAYLDERGWPAVLPVPAVKIKGDTLLFKDPGCPAGVFAAMAVITPDPVTYQVKGTLAGEGGARRLKVEEIYCGGVPLSGKRIF